MFSPAWIIKEKSLDINSNNDHSPHICSNESGIYVVYQIERIDLNVSIFKLDFKGTLIWKIVLPNNLYKLLSTISMCCNNQYIFITYQTDVSQLNICEVNMVDGTIALNTTIDIDTTDGTTENVSDVISTIYPSICCDQLYLYLTYYLNSTVTITKYALDLTESWDASCIISVQNPSKSYKKAIICKNSRGLYITYFTESDTSTDINLLKINKANGVNQGVVTWAVSQSAFDTTQPNINLSICCNVSDIYITYNDPTYNIIVIKYNLAGVQKWKIIQNNNSNIIYNLNPVICCDLKYVFFSYYTNGAYFNNTTAGGSDVIAFKINTDGTNIMACQFVDVDTNNNNMEPSICSNKFGLYISYTTFNTDTNIVVFQLDMNTFMNTIKSNFSLLHKFCTHRYANSFKQHISQHGFQLYGQQAAMYY